MSRLQTYFDKLAREIKSRLGMIASRNDTRDHLSLSLAWLQEASFFLRAATPSPRTFPISSSGGRLILFRQSRPLVALLLPQTRRNARSDYRGHDGEKRSPPRIAEMWCTSPWVVCPDLWRLSIEFIRHVTACNFAFSLLFSIFSQIFWSWSSQIRSRRARVSLPDRALGLR